MATRQLYLLKYRNSSSQRAHFGVFVPSAADTHVGTLIHVVGAPMAGYSLEFRRNYKPAESNEPHETVSVGQIANQFVRDETHTQRVRDNKPNGPIENLASTIRPPGISQNFLAPVDGVGDTLVL